MQMPVQMPSTHFTSDSRNGAARESSPVRSEKGLSQAGCCGANVCIPTPLGPVCHCAGVESPFC